MSANPRPRMEPSLQSAHRSVRLTRPQLNRNLRVLVAKGLVQRFTDEHGVLRFRTFVAKVKQ